MITAHGTVSTAVEAIKKGALDYIMKPFEQDDLKNIIHKAVLTRRLNEGEVFPGSDLDRTGIIGSGSDRAPPGFHQESGGDDHHGAHNG